MNRRKLGDLFRSQRGVFLSYSGLVKINFNVVCIICSRVSCIVFMTVRLVPRDAIIFFFNTWACIGIRGEGERSHATMTQDLRLASLRSALRR